MVLPFGAWFGQLWQLFLVISGVTGSSGDDLMLDTKT